MLKALYTTCFHSPFHKAVFLHLSVFIEHLHKCAEYGSDPPPGLEVSPLVCVGSVWVRLPLTVQRHVVHITLGLEKKLPVHFIPHSLRLCSMICLRHLHTSTGVSSSFLLFNLCITALTSSLLIPTTSWFTDCWDGTVRWLLLPQLVLLTVSLSKWSKNCVALATVLCVHYACSWSLHVLYSSPSSHSLFWLVLQMYVTAHNSHRKCKCSLDSILVLCCSLLNEVANRLCNSAGYRK